MDSLASLSKRGIDPLHFRAGLVKFPHLSLALRAGVGGGQDGFLL